MKLKTTIFSDILKIKKGKNIKYSQGRVYLFVFVLLYISCLIYFSIKPANIMDTIIDSLQWAILLFAVYAFGDKSSDTLNDLFGSKNKRKEDS